MSGDHLLDIGAGSVGHLGAGRVGGPDSERAQERLLVVRIVRVQPDPAVGRAMEGGKRREPGPVRAVDEQMAERPERCRHHARVQREPGRSGRWCERVQSGDEGLGGAEREPLDIERPSPPPPRSGARATAGADGRVLRENATTAEREPPQVGASRPIVLALISTGVEIPDSTGIEIPDSTGIEIPDSTGIEIPDSTGIEIPESTDMHAVATPGRGGTCRSGAR